MPNAGDEGPIVLARVRESKEKSYGYNAAPAEYEDLVKAGGDRPDQGDPDRAALR